MAGDKAMARSGLKGRNWRLFLALLGIVAGMTGLAFASVPLYRLFCQATGYDGTPRRGTEEALASLPGPSTDRKLEVTFTADVADGLGWRFQPVSRAVTLKVGEKTVIYYRAENLESASVVGRATFNVSPEVVAPYFVKIECFCFQEQTLAPGQSVEMPVSFYIDPAMLNDKSLGKIDTITLSYTFFRVPSSAGNQGDGKVAKKVEGTGENANAVN